MDVGRFIVRAMFLDWYPPNPYDFKDDSGRQVKGISHKIELKMGRGRNTTAEVALSQELHASLEKMAPMSEVECSCAVTVRDNSLRVQIENVRLAQVQTNHLPTPNVSAAKAS